METPAMNIIAGAVNQKVVIFNIC